MTNTKAIIEKLLSEGLDPATIESLLEPGKGKIALWIQSTLGLRVFQTWKSESNNIWSADAQIEDEHDVYVDLKPAMNHWDPDKDGIARFSIGKVNGEWEITAKLVRHRGLYSVSQADLDLITNAIIKEGDIKAYDPFDL